jgi:putative Ca2+/H+ antiporter (TMEM165/GDT1 family)
MSALLSAAAVVFVAELGDKTQLVALGFGARFRLAPVLGGMAVAYVGASTLSVALGALVGTALPSGVVRVAGGVLFLAFALWTALDVDEDPSGAGLAEGGSGRGGRDGSALRVAGSVAVAVFVAELGDKTMLATATLASQGDPGAVFVGATIGIFLAGALGALLGRALGGRLPARTVRFGAAALFAVFGVALILSAW